jgi:hypothetical protein
MVASRAGRDVSGRKDAAEPLGLELLRRRPLHVHEVAAALSERPLDLGG